MTRTRRIRRLGTATLQIGAALCATATVMAQSYVAIEEIAVTATKRAQVLLDVPLSVSAISSDDILVRGFTQYADYINSVPGVYLNDLGRAAWTFASAAWS